MLYGGLLPIMEFVKQIGLSDELELIFNCRVLRQTHFKERITAAFVAVAA
jgi:hypothetical protein